MKILTQNLKTGATDILNVPSPSQTSRKIRVKNEYSLISTGTESSIVNFGKVGWLAKARQQPDKVKDVFDKIRSSGFQETYKAVKNKLDFPMVMGYSAVGVVIQANEEHDIEEGVRVFTNSCHQEEGLIDYNLCVEIPDNLDSKSATFGAIGGIAMQSINCIPNGSNHIVLVGLGLLGQITLRILLAKGYKCIVTDIDKKKVELAEKYGAIGVHNSIAETVLNRTQGIGAEATIIAAASSSNQIVNDATKYTKRRGKIISSGVIGLNLIRDNFFKKQIELVVSNSSGDKNHRGIGSSYENIREFFGLISQGKVQVLDLISEEITMTDSSGIYSFPKDSMFFSKLIKYDHSRMESNQTFVKPTFSRNENKIKVGLIGTGNFAMSTLIPAINKSKIGYLSSLVGREGLSMVVAQKKFDVDIITTKEEDFYKNINAVCITTPHQTHFHFLKKAIELSLPVWIEKPLVISQDELVEIRERMLTTKSIYAVGYNRSSAPWTKLMQKKINGSKAIIEMTINAGILPEEHWLLNEKVCGGRIIGECCHFVDLSLTLLSHTRLISAECLARDRYFQDTGHFILSFADGSKVQINYRHDLPANLPKEKIIIEVNGRRFENHNWKKFLGSTLVGKGKGHNQAIVDFLSKVRAGGLSSKKDIETVCFSTYAALQLQNMSAGDILSIDKNYKNDMFMDIVTKI